MENNYHSNNHSAMLKEKRIRAIKGQARENLLGNYITIIGSVLLIQVVSTLISTCFSPMLNNNGFLQHGIYYVANFIVAMLTYFFYAGIYKMHLNLCRGQAIAWSDLAFPAKNGSNRFLIVSAVFALISYIQGIPRVMLTNYVNLEIIQNGTIDLQMTYLWTILTAIGFIIQLVLSLAFALSFYLLIDNPDMTAKEALVRSHHYMKGNKLRLFFLYISFVGLYLLGILTVGIAYLWLMPYMDQSVVVFYETLVHPNKSLEDTEPSVSSME